MYVKSVFMRFYKSFNFDYLRKVHPKAERFQWEDLDGKWFPYIKVPLDPLITTIVGANESGKSHLLSAIEIAITGKGLAEHDICRYSPFFSVEKGRRYWPQLGLELRDVTKSESEKLAALLQAELPDIDRFLMFRTEPAKAVVYVPGEDEAPVPRELYQRREFLTRRGFPFWDRCDSRLAKEIRHVSMHCPSERLRRR